MSKIYSNKGSAFKAKLSKFLNRLTGLLRPFDPFGGKGNRWNLAFFISHRVKIYFFQIIFIVAIMRMPLCQDQIFLDSNKMLRMHRFETETFQVNRIYGDFSGSIRAADKYYCEKTFDNTHRLSKEIFWIKNDNIELDSISSYFYESETSIPSKKEQIIFSENKFVETTFNEKNQPLEIKVYKLDDTKTRGTSRIASYSYGYDSQNRIVEEVFISEDNWQERRTYNYTNKSTQPDRKIFENNFLVLDVTHKNNKDRTEIIYFEDDFSVEKIYKDNAKKTEIFRHKGKIIRTRDLENDERFAQLDSEVKKNDEKTAATSTDKASDGEKSPETENPIEEREAQKAAKAAEQAAKEAQDAAKKAAEEAEAAAQKAKAEWEKIAQKAEDADEAIAKEADIKAAEAAELAKKAAEEAQKAIEESEKAAKIAAADAKKAAKEAAAEAKRIAKKAEKAAKKAEAEAKKAEKAAAAEAKRAAKEAEKAAKKASADGNTKEAAEKAEGEQQNGEVEAIKPEEVAEKSDKVGE